MEERCMYFKALNAFEMKKFLNIMSDNNKHKLVIIADGETTRDLHKLKHIDEWLCDYGNHNMLCTICNHEVHTSDTDWHRPLLTLFKQTAKSKVKEKSNLKLLFLNIFTFVKNFEVNRLGMKNSGRGLIAQFKWHCLCNSLGDALKAIFSDEPKEEKKRQRQPLLKQQIPVSIRLLTGISAS